MLAASVLSSMSHELRSPLNAILGFAQLMSSDTPPPTAAQMANIDPILHAGWYLLELRMYHSNRRECTISVVNAVKLWLAVRLRPVRKVSC